MNNKNYSIRAKGFTLVELLIAMTLGFFLIAGIGTVYLGSKKTYKLQGQTAELDENARQAIRALKQHIAHAGYASTSGIIIPNYIIPTGTDLSAAAATCANGSSNINSVTALATSDDNTDTVSAGDTLGLIFMADASLAADCAGGVLDNECLPPAAPSPEARFIYNSFSVGNSSIRNSRNGLVPMLRCGGSRNNARRDWARGVENIQFLYGVDSDGNGSVDNYWNATTVESAAVWDRIISVRVGLLIRSVEPVFDTDRSETYQVLDESITKDDRFKRGVYTTTVRLKNVARRM